jgi:DNA polymerase-3 subunit beta
MRIEVTQENLSRALHVVGRIAGGRTTLPILANILIVTDGSRLKLSTTNLEVGIIQYISAKVDEAGAITMPARLLHDYIASLPHTNITLSTQEQKLHIEAERFTSTINGIAADEFPSIPTVKSNQTLTLPSTELKTTLQRSLFAASTDDTRPVLTSVLLHTHKDSLYLAATDSYRLVEQEIPSEVSGKISNEIQLLLPARSLNELIRILPDEKAVELSWDDAQAELRFEDTTLITRLIEGTYPNYRDLIPTSSETSFEVGREELLSVTKVASLFARESAGGITLSVNEGQQAVSIRSVASQVGENTSEAEAKVSGSGEVTLNSRYLIEALNAMDADAIQFNFTGKVSPCLIVPIGKSGQLHVIMPLRS